MTTSYGTPDTPATTWRDLADQLTPAQVAELEYCEREQIPPGRADVPAVTVGTGSVTGCPVAPVRNLVRCGTASA